MESAAPQAQEGSADFRKALLRSAENAEAIALYRTGQYEHQCVARLSTRTEDGHTAWTKPSPFTGI